MTFMEKLKQEHPETVAEYIDRGKAILAACDGADAWDGGCNASRDKYLAEYIGSVPAADVVDARPGRWGDTATSLYRKCSECGCCVEWDKRPFLFGQGEYNYCPNCGAKMGGEWAE